LPVVSGKQPLLNSHPGLQKQQPPSEKEAISQDAPNDLEGTVEVAFRIDASGKVDILNINASNPKLIDYVVKKLGKIQLDQIDSQPGKVIKYRFVFKKQA
jgi:hypothetical protein